MTVLPSISSGYAKSSGQSAHPELWDGLQAAWVPALGNTGRYLTNLLGTTSRAALDSSEVWSSGGIPSLVAGDRESWGVPLTGLSALSAYNSPGTSLAVYYRLNATPTGPNQNNVFQLRVNASRRIAFDRLSTTWEFLARGVSSNPDVSLTFAYPELGKWTVDILAADGRNLRVFRGGKKLAGPATFAANIGMTDVNEGCFHGNNTRGVEAAATNIGYVLLYRRALGVGESRILTEDPLAPFRLRTRFFQAAAASTPQPFAIHQRRRQPLLTSGYAKNAGESANPGLWKGLAAAWAPALGGQPRNVRDVRRIADGTRSGTGTPWASTKDGVVAAFNGTDDYLSCGTYSSHQDLAKTGTDNLGMSVFVRFLSTVNNAGTLVARNDGNTIAPGWWVDINSSPTLRLVLERATTNAQLRIPAPSANVWHSVVFTAESGIANGGSAKAWMDGAPQAITLIGGSGSSASDSAETLYIGRYGKSSGGGSGFFSGYIAALYLWKNRILSPREALLLSSDPLAPFRLRDIHSGIYVNIIVGSTCWGHVTGVTQTNVRTFASHWTGSGIITGTGDSEELDLYIGQSMVSEVVNTGAVTVTLTQNSYQAGDTMTLEYRTGATQAACEASGWTAYTVPFASSGYVQCRVSK